MRKVLATAWHPGGVNAIAPVIKELMKQGRTEVVVIGHGYSEDLFRQKGISFKTIKNYGLEDVSALSMIELVTQEGPNLVLTGTGFQGNGVTDVIDQTITLAAKRYCYCPTIAVVDFWARCKDRFSDIFTGEPFKFLPTVIAIPDEFMAQEMVAEGFDRGILAVTGNPSFDELASLAAGYTAEMKAGTRNVLKVPEGALLVTYVTDVTADAIQLNYGFSDVNCVEILCQGILSSGKQVSLRIKKHPRETPENFAKLIKLAESYGLTEVKTECDARQIVLASDLIAAPMSTVLIEATLMNKDALSIQSRPAGEEAKDDFILNRMDMIPHIYDSKRGVGLIADILRGDNSYRERRKTFRVRGNATIKVVDLCYSMLFV